MAKNETVLVIGKVSLLSVPNAITEKFKPFEKEIIKPDTVKDFEVNTEESKTIAESKIKEINQLKTRIKDLGDEMKSPLNHIKNIVITSVKKLDDDLTLSKSLLNTKVTTYKELKAAQLRATEEKKRKEAEEEIERIEQIKKRINNMLSNFTSLLFGGDVVDNEGESSYTDPLTSVKDIDSLKDFISENFPSFDAFQEFSSEVVKHYENYMNDLEVYKSHIETGNTRAMNSMKIKYYGLCERSIQETEKLVEKEHKKVEKKLESELKEATKGIRSEIKFDVENPVIVPERYKMIDDSKVISYRKLHKEEILVAIKAGKGNTIIPGINFRIERKNVAY